MEFAGPHFPAGGVSKTPSLPCATFLAFIYGSHISPKPCLLPQGNRRSPRPARSRATASTHVHRVRAACAPLNGARRRASGGTSGAPNGHPGGRWQRQRREVFNSATSRQGGAGAAGLGLKAGRRARGRAFVYARPDHDHAALRAQIRRTLGVESGAAARRVHLCTTRQSSSARGANRRPQSTRRSEVGLRRQSAAENVGARPAQSTPCET